jgi:hypothetical protein
MFLISRQSVGWADSLDFYKAGALLG